MSQTKNLFSSTIAPIEASTFSLSLSVLDPPIQRMELLMRAKLIFPLDMIRYQRSCLLFKQRALMAVVSALMKLMGQLHQCMRRQADKMSLSQTRFFFVHKLVLSDRFMILVGFATAFRAFFCHELKILTSNWVLSNPDSQISLSLIFNLASSSVAVDLRANVYPCNSRR